jgi:hypothetical protein
MLERLHGKAALVVGAGATPAALFLASDESKT